MSDGQGNVVFHLALTVRDLVEAKQFYTEALGCSAGRAEAEWADVWFFGMQLTLHRRPDEARVNNADGVRHFGVAFTDRASFDAVIARVETHGIRWLVPPTWRPEPELSGKVEARFADPSGNVIELKHYPDPAAYFTGRG